MNIICFLTVKPVEKYYQFVKQIKQDIGNNYLIYICIDDNNYIIPNYDKDITIIQIDATESEENGFKNSVCYFPHKACSLDKALYYFCKKVDIDYKYIWFIEEDVFIPDTLTIKHIDVKYPDGDVLSKSNEIHSKRSCWHHMKRLLVECDIDLPYYVSMMCAQRLSKQLMEIISKYAFTRNTLHFHEMLMTTLAMKNNLLVKPIEELSNIFWKKKFDDNMKIDIRKLYHPIKSIDQQWSMRKNLQTI